jgi:O-antigen/teichoic acid export membrane protein
MDEPLPARGGRDASALAAGSLVSGVLAYVFFAMVTRALGAEPAAPVAVLWAWWSFAGAAVTFPVQHWISRTAAMPAGEAGVRRGLGVVAAAVTGASVVAGGLAWLGSERLFGPHGTWFPLLVVAVGLGSGVLGVVRGTLSGRHRFGAVGLGLVVENAIRCLAAAALMAAGDDRPVAYGLALVAGYAAAVLWPAALVPRTTGTGRGGGSPLGFVTGASAGQLLAQLTLTGGPVLLAAVGGAPAQVTALFAGLALFRAPYTLAIGLVAGLTGRLTRWIEAGRTDLLARMREGVVAATLVVGALAAALGAWLGPDVMELIFGSGVRLPAEDTALVAVGSVLALANLVLTVELLAHGRTVALVRTWLVAVPFGVATHLLLGEDALARTCWTFLAVEAVAWAGFLLLAWPSYRLVGGQEHR